MFDPKTRIVVCDDMMTMRKLVVKVCKELGFTDIQEGADGAKGWELIANANPPIGLVISDWNMPNSTGLDLVKRIRSDSRYKTLPFVMVTAEAEQHQIVEAIKSGVSNYVVKPFTADQLKEKLEAVHQKMLGAVPGAAAAPTKPAAPTAPVAAAPAKPVTPTAPVAAAPPKPVTPTAPVAAAPAKPVTPAAPVAAAPPKPAAPTAPVAAAPAKPAAPTAPVAAAPAKPVAPAAPVAAAPAKPVAPAAPVAAAPAKPATPAAPATTAATAPVRKSA